VIFIIWDLLDLARAARFPSIHERRAWSPETGPELESTRITAMNGESIGGPHKQNEKKEITAFLRYIVKRQVHSGGIINVPGSFFVPGTVLGSMSGHDVLEQMIHDQGSHSRVLWCLCWLLGEVAGVELSI
jgi:hypothetical protein